MASLLRRVLDVWKSQLTGFTICDQQHRLCGAVMGYVNLNWAVLQETLIF